jgi:hypothetical protein
MEQYKKLMLKALPFTIIEWKLCKQGQDQIMCRCLHDDKILVILREMHKRVGGGHFLANITARKVLQILVANSTQGCTTTLSIL